jgi:hypothetical protein
MIAISLRGLSRSRCRASIFYSRSVRGCGGGNA